MKLQNKSTSKEAAKSSDLLSELTPEQLSAIAGGDGWWRPVGSVHLSDNHNITMVSRKAIH
ncbi:MAG: hypothetical protein AAF215_21070 [Cyanobacteria bacterium P01_A01_bin.123]